MCKFFTIYVSSAASYQSCDSLQVWGFFLSLLTFLKIETPALITSMPHQVPTWKCLLWDTDLFLVPGLFYCLT